MGIRNTKVISTVYVHVANVAKKAKLLNRAVRYYKIKFVFVMLHSLNLRYLIAQDKIKK